MHNYLIIIINKLLLLLSTSSSLCINVCFVYKCFYSAEYAVAIKIVYKFIKVDLSLPKKQTYVS